MKSNTPLVQTAAAPPPCTAALTQNPTASTPVTAKSVPFRIREFSNPAFLPHYTSLLEYPVMNGLDGNQDKELNDLVRNLTKVVDIPTDEDENPMETV